MVFVGFIGSELLLSEEIEDSKERNTKEIEINENRILCLIN
jgi:hypothetical protein